MSINIGFAPTSVTAMAVADAECDGRITSSPFPIFCDNKLMIIASVPLLTPTVNFAPLNLENSLSNNFTFSPKI